MGGDIDAVVVGVGSGGTLTGIGRFMARHSPKTQMVLADPVGSILCDYVATGTYGEAGSWIVEGIGEDFIPANAQMDFVGKAYSISDRESVDTARLLLRKEGVLAGSSSGTLLAAALRWCREQTEPKRVVTLVCDTGAKYLTKMFNDMWLAAHGFDQRELHGDLRDLIAKRYADGGVVAIGPDDTLLTAYNRMRSSDVSQLPVVDHGKLVGILDESDILAAVEGADDDRGPKFKTPVGRAMTKAVNTLQSTQGGRRPAGGVRPRRGGPGLRRRRVRRGDHAGGPDQPSAAERLRKCSRGVILGLRKREGRMTHESRNCLRPWRSSLRIASPKVGTKMSAMCDRLWISALQEA
jgi:cystathionine beta-synthase